MIRVRQVYDIHSPNNIGAIAQVQEIMRTQVAKTPASYIAGLPALLSDPLTAGFSAVLFVAETASDRLRGFALLLLATDLKFGFLEMIATALGRTSSGYGSILYERVRDEAMRGKADGLFFECVTDNPNYGQSAEVMKQNVARLRFYERYNARPVTNTIDEEPANESDNEPLFLMFDPLGTSKLPRRDRARAVVRALLQRKYSHLLPPAQIDQVVASFRDDPIVLRPPRYMARETPRMAHHAVPLATIPIVVSDRHQIHHVSSRDYVEAPIRIRTILPELERTGLFRKVPPKTYSAAHISAVHDKAFVDYLRRASASIDGKHSIYPQIFPIRNRARPPRELPMRAGYFCIDTFTPLNENAYIAAKHAVDCALTAADQVLEGEPLAYALVRPPGHHAETAAMGGYCYFNNAAIAAQNLSLYGRTAILDIDYHHGNGTQDIFFRRPDILTVSIHGDPRIAYPYFSGFEDETGDGPGQGFNLNIPLPEHITYERYQRAIRQALRRIAKFKPNYLVLAVGFDTAKGDPTATWPLVAKDFHRIGYTLGETGYTMLVIQEGGYRTRTLGVNARHFFVGLAEGMHMARTLVRP